MQNALRALLGIFNQSNTNHHVLEKQALIVTWPGMQLAAYIQSI